MTKINEQLIEEIMTWLTAQRTASLANTSGHFGFTCKDFIPIVSHLISLGLVRISNSRCQSDCSSCGSSCSTTDSAPPLTENSIIISLRTRQEQL